MPKGYWIAQGDVAKPEAYEAYKAANAAPIARHGGKFIVRGGPQDAMEGRWRSRTVVIEFPSYEAALACYNDPEYQIAKQMRLPLSTNDMVIVEGYDG